MPMMQVAVQTPSPMPPDLPFDPNAALQAVVPLIGIVALALAVAFMVRWFLRSPIGEAMAEGMRERRHRRHGWRGFGMEWTDDPGESEPGRVATLEQEVTRLRGELSELAERLDFAERMLAERREPGLRAGQ